MRAKLLLFVATSACSWTPTNDVGAPPSSDVCSCKATIIADADGFPVAFGIDDANVYWSSPWQSVLAPPISAVAKDGSQPTGFPASGCDVSGMIVADATSVYAPCESNLHGLERFPKNGGTSSTLVPTDVVSQAYVDADGNLFWAGGGGIWKKQPGQAPVQVVTGDVITFAVDGGDYYWWGLDREIRSTTIATIAHAEVPLDGLVADGSALYWIDTSARTIAVAPHGGDPTVLLAGLEQPGAIALDATFVYAIGVFEQRSAVVRVPKAGGPALILYVGGSLTGLAVDDAAVYTTDTRTTSTTMTMSVVRIDKPH